jgi:hypothetical protein
LIRDPSIQIYSSDITVNRPNEQLKKEIYIEDENPNEMQIDQKRISEIH